MTCTEFCDNLSRLSDGESFSADLLKALYSSIKSNALPWAGYVCWRVARDAS